MTDERLAEFDGRTWDAWSGRGPRELLDALVAERNEVERLEARVVRLEAALTQLLEMVGREPYKPKTELEYRRAKTVLAEGART